MVAREQRCLVGLLVGAALSCLLVLQMVKFARNNEELEPQFEPHIVLPGSFIQERLMLAESIWSDAARQRHNYMKRFDKLESFDPWGNSGEFTVIWNLFAPTFDCPHMRRRVGKIGDGGKWLCGFELFEKTKSNSPCVVYSFGIAGESSFEEEILEKTDCDVYGYDMTVNGWGPQVGRNNPRAHFQKIGLGPNDTNTLKSLKTLMEENGHEWIDIFKIDIEGAEFDALDVVLDNFEPLPFGQFQVEVHLDHYSIPGFYRWFERLEAAGLRAFSSEINLNPCVRIKPADPPYLMEYSFINVKTNHRLVPTPIA